MVTPTPYSWGTQGVIASIETKPLVVHQVSGAPHRRQRQLGSFEIRPASFRFASYLLGVSIADLDCVRDARSLADLAHCPACAPCQVD